MVTDTYKTRLWTAILVIMLLLVIDQMIKIAVKTGMCLHESIRITDWFYISFIENNGMAYGMTLVNKLVLSLFRVAAISVLGWYLFRQIKFNARKFYVICLSLVFAGAVGNMLDCMFYGMIFNESYSQVATLFPPEGGYSSFLHGKVVDMLYFPIYEGFLPDWLPIWGGKFFVFFRPVFNFADSYITIGVLILLLFYRKFFSTKKA